MMTWHTRFSFARSAQDLEDAQLRAQIEDAADLMDMIMSGEKRPTQPAFYMWSGSISALVIMGMMYSMEWTFHRGYDDKIFWRFKRCHDELKSRGDGSASYWPPGWFRDEALVMSHRSALIARHGATYAEQWPSAPRDMPLLWPDPGTYPDRAGRGEAEAYLAVANLRVAKADLPLVRQKKLTIPSKYKMRVVNL